MELLHKAKVDELKGHSLSRDVEFKTKLTDIKEEFIRKAEKVHQTFVSAFSQSASLVNKMVSDQKDLYSSAFALLNKHFLIDFDSTIAKIGNDCTKAVNVSFILIINYRLIGNLTEG